MTTFKESLLNCIELEIKSCKHIATVFPEGAFDFRPIENTRTALEVMRYLASTPIFTINYYLKCTPEQMSDNYKYYGERVASMTVEEFPAAMDAQLQEIRDLMADITDEDLNSRTVTYPWKAEAPLGQAIIETTIKWLAAYKMQLFLYAKQAGASQLNTYDCWIAGYKETEQKSEKAVEEEV